MPGWNWLGRRPALAFVGLAAVIGGVSKTASAQGVGYRDMATEVGGERLSVAIWYPTEAPPGQVAVGPFVMAASRNVAVGSQRYGLVLISHGAGGSSLSHNETALRLARDGYIVAAPEHTGDNYRDNRYAGRAANWIRRPRQLSATLDLLLGDQELGRRIDATRIGAVGHSIGGYSVLALVGAKADLGVLAHHCTERRALDEAFCGYGQTEEGAPVAIPHLADRRVAAAVAVAPVGAVFGQSAFREVTAEIQIHRMEDDQVLRRPWHAENIANLMEDSAAVVVHPNAHHFAFISPFPPAIAASVGPAAQDPAGFDRRAFLAALDKQILGFLNTVLPSGDP